MTHSLFPALVSLLAAVAAAGVRSETDVPSPPADTLVRYVSDHEIRVGNVLMDISALTVSAPGWVNQKTGLVEYLAVTSEGKRHESVLVLDVQPLHLQTALLLFGLDFGQNLAFQGDSVPPRGDSVDISVAWLGPEGDSVVVPASELLFDYHDSVVAPTTPWVFTGSMIHLDRLQADLEGSIIATYSDPVAILNNPASARSDDTFYGVNEALVPPPGTPVVLIITVPLRTGEDK
ncbi:MAG TPA: YdjY domain-containing protein [candidate division Zixibacteria bacterium]|nr:hypothetical protein [candidate division Zixibacteria bacterium]MDD4917995.1 YdjY domain-containing protein [candidate division Zixibacteria bacterium]MDM7972453.1 YdjY domain-containing protein [candidate division Zixibacteria bacterium]HOD66539.1 YdjY domain-containing protein [candidate division Zixibacteria bacterium]HPC11567.1 YdjY domain-containing protein [candidate division Zixibacteria bacterium]